MTNQQTYSLSFRQLPIHTDCSVVIYLESHFDVEVNHYISTHYDAIKTHFSQQGYRFVYLPLLLKDMEADGALAYYAPYLNKEAKASLNISTSWLLSYLANPEQQDIIQPSLLFAGSSDGVVSTYQCLPIRNFAFSQTSNFSVVLDTIIAIGMKQKEAKRKTVEEEKRIERKKGRRPFFKSLKRGFDNMTGELFGNEPVAAKSVTCEDSIHFDMMLTADDTFTEESRALIEEVQQKIALLRQMGLNWAVIEAYIHQDEKISRLVISKQFEITLPDYNDMQIEMTPLCKAVYFLFLHHPEGIMFSHLPDYRDELLRIYTQIKDGYQTEAMRQSVDRLTDPFDNSINEKCARIREAFLKKFDARLARHYVIDGDRGEPKAIALPRNLVFWE